MTPRPLKKPLQNKAFTLVETVLALGIVSTVMIALVGLMPAGMNIVRQAGEQTVGAQVAQKLIGEIQLAEFDDVEQLASKGVRFFDDMGTEMDADGVTRFYRAVIEVSPQRPALPGMKASDHLKMLVVKVSGSPKEDIDFSDPSSEESYLAYQRYTTLIVDVEDEE